VRLQEFDELKVYARKLAAKNQVDRPTAEEWLQWLWNQYRNSLREEFLEKNHKLKMNINYLYINQVVINNDHKTFSSLKL